jgi:PAS domain S-box-containing protein
MSLESDPDRPPGSRNRTPMRDDNRNFDRQRLRKQALERLHAQGGKFDVTPDEARSLADELELSQVELEVQNEELGRTRQALAREVERYRDLYDRAPVAYFTLSADTRIVQANRSAVALCSLEQDEIEGRRFAALVVASNRAKLEQVLRSAASTGRPQSTELQIQCGRSTPRWVHTEVSWLGSREGTGSYRVMMVDVTSRVQTQAGLVEQHTAAVKHMEKAVSAFAHAEDAMARLRESEERFRVASDAGGALVYQVDLTGARRSIVHGLERVTGYRFPPRNAAPDWWDSLIHPDDVTAYRDHVARRVETGAAYFSVYRIRRSDGRWILVEDTGQVVHDVHGTPVKMVGAIVDVTDRKKAEDALREANTRKDEFLATLAHELRNPLAPIRNAVEILRDRDMDPASLRWARDIIERQVDQMSRLVDDLLDVSRITRGKSRPAGR